MSQQNVLRVLVVDDSAYNRRAIAQVISAMEGVEVVGKAADGDEALRMVGELSPDLITLDLEMPRMDGFTFLRLLMARRPTPVIVVSGYSDKENVFRALELGALDFVAKPERRGGPLGEVAQELADKVKLVRHLSPAGFDKPRKRVSEEIAVVPERSSRPAPTTTPRRLLVVGASTGGPSALIEIFSRIPLHSAVAAVVAQHMPERFTRTFAQRLDRLQGLQFREASGVAPLVSGEGLVCPGGKCVEVVPMQNGLGVRVVDPAGDDRYVPSVDRLFESAAKVAGPRVVAVVLTGMGDDGSRGIVAIKEAGGTVLAEAPETAVIYGMPGSAVRTGLVDRSLPLPALAAHLVSLCR